MGSNSLLKNCQKQYTTVLCTVRLRTNYFRKLTDDEIVSNSDISMNSNDRNTATPDKV